MPTRRRALVRENSTFSNQPDGTVVAHFDVLDVSGTGSDEEEAFQALRAAIGEKLQADESVHPAWSEWAENNNVEEEVPEEEVRAQQEMIARSHEASAAFVKLTLADLDDAIASETPVLVDFWAEWCMPCHMMAPVLKEVADDLAGRMTVAKINTDENEGLWERFSIEGIPTLILFAKGEERHRIIGAGRPKEQLLGELEPHLA